MFRQTRLRAVYIQTRDDAARAKQHHIAGEAIASRRARAEEPSNDSNILNQGSQQGRSPYDGVPVVQDTKD